MSLDSLNLLLRTHGYRLLVPLSLIEGPGVAFAAGTLSSLGFFNPFIVYGLFVSKDLLVDSFFYGLGRLGRDQGVVTRLLTKARVTAGELARIRGLWNRHTWWTMCVAKLSWGLSPALLATAGIAAVPAATFVWYALGVAIAQYGLLLPLDTTSVTRSTASRQRCGWSGTSSLGPCWPALSTAADARGTKRSARERSRSARATESSRSRRRLPADGSGRGCGPSR